MIEVHRYTRTFILFILRWIYFHDMLIYRFWHTKKAMKQNVDYKSFVYILLFVIQLFQSSYIYSKSVKGDEKHCTLYK